MNTNGKFPQFSYSLAFSFWLKMDFSRDLGVDRKHLMLMHIPLQQSLLQLEKYTSATKINFHILGRLIVEQAEQH